MRSKDHIGERYNRLIFLKPADPMKYGPGRWWFKCDCGTVFITTSKLVLSNRTKSCGCLRKEKCSERAAYMRGFKKKRVV